VAQSLSPALVARDRELYLVKDMVRDLRAGKAGTLLIEGEAGIGKTRLLDDMLDDARAGGVLVYRGEAHPLERTRPFGVLAAALELQRRSPDPRRAAIGRLIVGDAETSGAAPGGPPDQRHRIVEDIVDLVESSCAEGPVLLALEDLHWAEASTLLAVRSIVIGLVHVPFLLVASLRPSPRSAELDHILDDLLKAGARLLRLEALSTEGVDSVARDVLGDPPGPRLTGLLAKAGGNPLWVVEILRSLTDEDVLQRGDSGIEATTSEIPDSLRELVVRRLRYLSDATLDLLQVVAVLGDAVSVRDLASVARREEADLVADLTEAFRAGLLGDQGDALVFRHQLVHDAVYQNVPGPLRQTMHRDAAATLRAAGADPLQVAEHLLRGAVRGDLEAVNWLRQAARDAAGGAPLVSVELLRRAESILPGGHPDADLLSAELVEALLRAGHVAAAAGRAEAMLNRRHRLEVDKSLRLSLISAMSIQNRAWELIDRAEAELVQAPELPPADQSLVLAQASYGRTFSGDIVGGEATARRALDLAERSSDTAMVVWSLVAMWVAVSRQGRYAEALALTRRAVQLASDSSQPAARLRHPHFFLGMALCDSDLMEEGSIAYETALDEYHELGSAWLLPDTLLMSATRRFLTGEWEDAAPGLEAGLRVAHEQGQRILVAHSRALQAVMAIAGGDHREGETLLAPFQAELVSDAPAFAAEMVAFAAALLAEAEGDSAKACELLLRFWKLDLERDNRYFHRYLAPPLVRLALALDKRELAQKVTEVTEEAASRAVEVPTITAAASRCRGLVDNDPDRLLEAVELARRGPRLLDHAGACEDAAAVLVSAGRSGEAKALLLEALQLYESAGASAWAARAGASLRRLGVRRGVREARRRPNRGWASLTTTEISVSRLVAEGLTNRDVARRLHMSPHTVNTHLRHVFDKLSVSNRTELAAVIARSSGPGDGTPDLAQIHSIE
jgi:DNA-binding CsgD family transcriptional regulator/tetratricopeptide (TPR) repeat protein